MTYTVEQVDQVADWLRALPAIDDSQRRMDKQGAVKRLAAEIAALQERGYTIEQVADGITGRGIQITTPTLKTYLQRIKKLTGNGARKTARRAVSPAGRKHTGSAPNETEKTPAAGPSLATKTESGAAPRNTRTEFIATDRERL